MGLKGKDPSTGSNADLSCIYLEGKQDHQPIPVLHIVQAYGAFKVKAKVIGAISLTATLLLISK